MKWLRMRQLPETLLNEDPVRHSKGAAQRIFNAALDLFYHRGIRAVGVEDIVSEAGVTKPSLYRSFASKEDLVLGVP